MFHPNPWNVTNGGGGRQVLSRRIFVRTYVRIHACAEERHILIYSLLPLFHTDVDYNLLKLELAKVHSEVPYVPETPVPRNYGTYMRL